MVTRIEIGQSVRKAIIAPTTIGRRLRLAARRKVHAIDVGELAAEMLADKALQLRESKIDDIIFHILNATVQMGWQLR